VVITERGFDKCSRLLRLLLATGTAHLPGAEASTVQSYRQRGEKRIGVEKGWRRRGEKAHDQEDEETNGKETGRRRQWPNQNTNPWIQCCVHPQGQCCLATR